ncbi:transient receptor potential cation channel subfamily A member 1-like [Anneissia japonica]|uniref:transient receptor potential cation channel subfamily A member 1-like n=1 Tax=Anneissia japonica TaxID=1529436 RepID=UPI001425B9CD|nr:transient receptor potential cation channel subfamily A member 1-like [Anneissia japonica]
MTDNLITFVRRGTHSGIEMINRIKSIGSGNGRRHGTTTSSSMMHMVPSEEDMVNGITQESAFAFEVCSIFDSPYRLIKIAEKGNYDEFMELFHSKPDLINFKDKRGAGVLHHSVKGNNVHIMEFLIAQDVDVNLPDSALNTPLHWAATHDKPEAAQLLLDHGANPNALNGNHQSPLHIGCDRECVRIVAILSNHRETDINLTGDAGQTPLHYCAVKDNIETAKILIRKEAKITIPDANGMYVLHAAATHASSRVLDLLFKEGEKAGCTRMSMLSLLDKEQNSALHCAVNGGDINAVKLCLDFGVSLDVKQDDGSTPIHLACSLGCLNIMKLMLERQPGKHLLEMKDSQHQTPIHKAAMFDHEELVRFLINEGSNIDPVDKHNRTPLLLATARGGWRTVRLLLSRGADYNRVDGQDRNILHLTAINGAGPLFFGKELFKGKDARLLLNMQDCHGCTPMHYATKEGNMKSVMGLIELGATVNSKDKHKQSPLHFAAKYGRFNSCRRMLDSRHGQMIINIADGEGKTALHIAALHGQAKVVQLLLHRGALLHKDHNGRTPLHLASMGGYTNTMSVLLATHPQLLDMVDDEENTALHLAAQYAHSGAVKFLLDSNAKIVSNLDNLTIVDMAIENKNKYVALAIVQNDRWKEALGNCCRYTLGLIEHLPDVCLVLLDRCVTKSDEEPESKEFWYKYDFTFLKSSGFVTKLYNTKGLELMPLLPLNKMVEFNRINCLSHPVCLHFLSMKWASYGRPVYMINIFIYAIFLMFLTGFVVEAPHKNTNGNHIYPTSTADVITVFAAVNMVKEIIQMSYQREKYFREATNAIEWILYISSMIFVAPFLVHNSSHYQWSCGAVAIFLAWFNFLLYLQRFDIFGIYVVMFLEILKTLIQVLLVFSILIIAFGLALYILLSEEENHAHKTVGLSLMHIVVMMLGEIDYINSFVDPATDDRKETMHFESLSFFFIFMLILLMPILLMNLLIGLAVGDIAGVQRNAQLKRLAMQVDLHTDLEQKLPSKIIQYRNATEYTVYPNCSRFFMLKLWKKIRETAGMDEDTTQMERITEATTDPAFDLVHKEQLKQKRRFKEMQQQISKQLDLLKLIVQKMEIKSEADDEDEGDNIRDKNKVHLSQVVRQTMVLKAFHTQLSQASSLGVRRCSSTTEPMVAPPSVATVDEVNENELEKGNDNETSSSEDGEEVGDEENKQRESDATVSITDDSDGAQSYKC